MSNLAIRFSSSLILLGSVSPAAFAHDPNALQLDTIRVHGRAVDLIGQANAASEGVVGYADFENRPLSRSGELIEVIPGAIATQHSGEGKANQYFLRGFNLDHGTDFSASVDGVPGNMRTHGHGQGYLDVNFLIPELVERVNYSKGPNDAANGDFSSAGSARYTTKSDLAANFIKVGVGENGYLRTVLAGAKHPTDSTTLLGALEVQKYDGPWELDQDVEKYSGLVKFINEGFNARYEVIATGYENSWTSTDQVPLRAIQSGQIGRFGYIDPDLGGETQRYSISANASLRHGLGTSTKLSGYIVDYGLTLFSDFTYFLDDPENGDEFEQEDDRIIYGADLSHTHRINADWSWEAGLSTRYDDIAGLGLYKTRARERLSTTRRDTVEEFSLSGWTKLNGQLTDALRATVGLRADWYDAEVTSLSLPKNSGSDSDSLVSRSLALAWKANSNLEFYANYGQGFHSNDVRGATITIDPASGEPATQVPILVQSDGIELGARYSVTGFNATIALFQLDMDSELVFVGDAGTTEPNDASTRQGIEASLFWQPNSWLTLDTGGAITDAEFDIEGAERETPGAVKNVFSAGALAYWGPVSLSARVRHLGESPLIEDGSVTSDPTTLLNLGAWYGWSKFELGLEVLNATDAEDADITYFFESQLANETSAVEDLHIHPVEPRQVRFSLTYSF